MEIWKDVKGYEGLYQVSTQGNVRSFHSFRGSNQRILRPRKCTNGYMSVCLSKNGVISYKLIHRLVAQAFIDNPFDYEQVNHKDENITNNQVDNLEWCTAKYNSNYGSHNKRISESKKGVHPSEKVIDAMRIRMIERHKNTPHPMLGKNHTKEAREKMSESRKKRVVCIETGEVFDSLKSAEEFAHATTVVYALKGKQKTSGGYHWRYV